MGERVTLQPVDAADVTILIDNAIDILVPGTEVPSARRLCGTGPSAIRSGPSTATP